ncbi:MAG: right-handed parallel beta-helix repeat-containing protein, partial [Calditrichia bacterium]|nr:right-handed parallel beta-helix repeat-containing protein [Calditrichia bacterium]
MKLRYFVIFTLVFFYGSLLAQITRSGVIDGETWTADDSLYIITDNITVIDLIIEPGVIVQFDGNHKFDVDGVLQAKGFFSDSIYFQPVPGNDVGWEGIKFKSGSIASSLQYCRIEGASKEGINIDQAQPEISNCRIVDNDENGIFLKSTIIQLQHCIISNNTLSGIETDAAKLTILNSIISGNVESGILSTHNDDIIVLTNVVIADNQDRGVDCPNGILTIRNSIIYDNTLQIDSQDGNTDVTYS